MISVILSICFNSSKSYSNRSVRLDIQHKKERFNSSKSYSNQRNFTSIIFRTFVSTLLRATQTKVSSLKNTSGITRFNSSKSYSNTPFATQNSGGHDSFNSSKSYSNEIKYFGIVVLERMFQLF